MGYTEICGYISRRQCSRNATPSGGFSWDFACRCHVWGCGGELPVVGWAKNNAPEGVQYSQRYLEAAENQEIADMVQRVLSGDFKANDKVYLGTVSQKNAAKIQEITGINVDGFRIAIEARQIEHILNRHGIEGSADHSMAAVSDISKIEYTLSTPDNIKPAGKTQAYTYMRNGKNRTADTVIYEKGIGERTYYAVQAVADTKAKTLYIVTAFIQKNNDGASQLIDANGPDVNAQDGSVVAPNERVAQPGARSQGEIAELFPHAARRRTANT